MKNAQEDARAAHADKRAAYADARAATAELLVAQANLASLRLKHLDGMRYKQVLCVRGAFDMMLDELGREPNKASLAAYYAKDPRGAAVLKCCNADPKVIRDHFNKPHTAESLAELVLRIRERLNNDAHVKTTAKEYKDAGDHLVMFADGMSEAHVQVMGCQFPSAEFPVRVVSRVWPLGSEDSGA